VKIFEADDWRVDADKALDRLFETFPCNCRIEEVYLKVVALDDLYSTQLRRGRKAASALHEIAKEVRQLATDSELAQRLPDVVDKIAAIKVGGKRCVALKFLPEELALSVDLEQSPFLNVLSDSKVNGTLRLMGHSPNERVTEELGREICLRAGSKALLAGLIASLGSHYAIGLNAVNCQTGDSLGSAQAEADSREKILPALGQATTTLRGKLGESLASIQKFDKPLEEATTSSLEALQAYSEGIRQELEKGDAASVPYYKHAVELDPNFARAYAAIAVRYANLGQASLATANSRKAYELRDRVSQREKYYISAQYYTYVTGELEKATEQYELLIQNYPRDALAYTNIAVGYSTEAQYEKAAAETRETLRLDPNNVLAYTNLAECYLNLNRLDEAKATFEQAVANHPDDPYLHLNMYYLAFLQGDGAAMQQQVSWAMGKPGTEDLLLSAQSDTEAYHGRLAKARDLSQRAADSAKSNDAKETAAIWEVNQALREAEFGNATQTRQFASAALALAPDVTGEGGWGALRSLGIGLLVIGVIFRCFFPRGQLRLTT
jgi:eukaryotic-like serine/threonine-protein kinase